MSQCTEVLENPIFINTFGACQIATGLLILIFQFVKLRNVRDRSGNKAYDVQSQSDWIVLPVYIYALWLFAAADIFQGVVTLTTPYLVMENNTLEASILYAASLGLYHFMAEGLAFLLMQPGAGTRAFIRMMYPAAAWGLATAAVEFLRMHDSGSTSGRLASIGYEAVLFLFYAGIWCLPALWFFRRPAVKLYSQFWSVVHLLFLVDAFLILFEVPGGSCISLLLLSVVYGIVKPFIVFYVLLQDSHYWRGVLSDSSSMQAPLLGISLQKESAENLAISVDTLSATARVPLLNHAFLHIQEGAKPIGFGGSSRVYLASYRGQPVAVKMCWCIDLTPDIIASFVREASLLASFQHDSVVRLVGACVRPPALCLVMELCHFGSLDDLLHKQDKRIELTVHNRLLLALQCAQALAFLHKQTPALLHLDLKPANFLVARTSKDVKMRTGWDFQVKVADLELSVTSEGKDWLTAEAPAPRASEPKQKPARTQGRAALLPQTGSAEPIKEVWFRSPPPSPPNAALMGKAPATSHPGVLSWESSVGSSGYTTGSSQSSSTGRDSMGRTQSGLRKPLHRVLESFRIPDTVNWTAPELLLGHSPNTKTDVYSLAMIFYEILTERIPFSELEIGQHQMREGIMKAVLRHNYRPPLGFQSLGGLCGNAEASRRRRDGPEDGKIYEKQIVHILDEFRRLIQSMWAPNPEDRPAANQCVNIMHSLCVRMHELDRGV